MDISKVTEVSLKRKHEEEVETSTVATSTVATSTVATSNDTSSDDSSDDSSVSESESYTEDEEVTKPTEVRSLTPAPTVTMMKHYVMCAMADPLLTKKDPRGVVAGFSNMVTYNGRRKKDLTVAIRFPTEEACTLAHESDLEMYDEVLGRYFDRINAGYSDGAPEVVCDMLVGQRPDIEILDDAPFVIYKFYIGDDVWDGHV